MEGEPGGTSQTPRSRRNSQHSPVLVDHDEELSAPVQVDSEDAEGELSPPVPLATAPPHIEPPQVGKTIPLPTARFWVALFSIGILAFVVVASFVSLWLGDSIDNLTRLLDILFAPLVALVAAAVAFYYYRGKNLS